MDVRAILITGVPAELDAGAGSESIETFSGTPLVFLPVLGKPVLHRVIERLQRNGIEAITIINGAEESPFLTDARRSEVKWKDFDASDVWRAAQEEFSDSAQAGAEIVIAMRVGAYAELDVDALLQFHLDQHSHITLVEAEDGPLDIAVLSGSRRNDATFLLRNKLRKLRVSSPAFPMIGYCNRLRSAADLRQLALDSFALRTTIQPDGEQVRPGVWVAPKARIARGVRLVAPCFVGAYTRIRGGALITRGSTIEHHCVIDGGSVVENSTMLPLSYLGKGLDLMHSVVGSKKLESLSHAAQVEIEDSSLISMLPATSGLRTLSHAASLLAFVPRQIVRHAASTKVRKSRAEEPQSAPASFDPAVACEVAPERPTAVAGMRRYGNQ
ncbi:MAG TPA: hypothetical protein VFQ00_00565 [Terriglobales bacterium]|nr:hypothetical protein [Terriglobales bacterium]